MIINQESYKNILLTDIKLSPRIRKWAKDNGIQSLYELIDELEKTDAKINIPLPDLNVEKYDNIVTLNDENGNEVKFEFLDLIEYNDNEYVVLLPVLSSEEEDNGEVVILKVEDVDTSDEESYVSVDNEDDLAAIFNIFKNKFADEFDFVDQ